MRFLIPSVFLLLAAGLASPGSLTAAAWYPDEFSADMTVTDPHNPQEQTKARIYVGKHRFRTESGPPGKRQALIVRSKSRQVWTLLTDEGKYYKGMGNKPIWPPKPDVDPLPWEAAGPCKQLKNITCDRIATETIHDIQTEKWEIRFTRQRHTRKMTLWADPQRRIVIKQQPDKGPTMVRKLLGTEPVHGRPTEKWEFTDHFQGKSHSHLQWVDTQLRIPVRTSGEKGIVMEVTDLKPGPQPENLFELPAGFQKTRPPPRPLQSAPRPLAPPPPSKPNKPLQYH